MNMREIGHDDMRNLLINERNGVFRHANTKVGQQDVASMDASIFSRTRLLAHKFFVEII